MKFLEFDEERDFPYYKHNPQISKLGWAILILLLPISFIMQYIFYTITGTDIIGSAAFCLTLLIPLLYFSKWDYTLIFKKPTRNEIILAALMFAGYMIYATIVGNGLDIMGLSGIENGTVTSYITLDATIGLIFSMMGEELIKFIPLMFFMRLIYKYSENRKLSLAISTTIVLIMFGLIHYLPPENTLISVLLLQGLGSIFEMYGYIKTKNLFVPYISHILTDAVIFILILMGIGY